ncbi:YgaP family membrane protein [Halorubrum alkaliphilum]
MMGMGDRDQNVGRLDRLLRVPLGVSAAVIAGWVFIAYPLEVAVGVSVILPLALLAAILLISATTGTCGIYGVFGINTCGDEVCTEADSDEAWVAE